jgi:hypothetical protein
MVAREDPLRFAGMDLRGVEFSGARGMQAILRLGRSERRAGWMASSPDARASRKMALGSGGVLNLKVRGRDGRRFPIVLSHNRQHLIETNGKNVINELPGVCDRSNMDAFLPMRQSSKVCAGWVNAQADHGLGGGGAPQRKRTAAILGYFLRNGKLNNPPARSSGFRRCLERV